VKSQVTDLLELARQVYTDACARCIADVSDIRDLKTIRSRVKREGISFLTITLPAFCKDFEKSLAQGFVDSMSFRGFRKFKAIPAFLRGMLSQLFDVETGRILDVPLASNPSTIVGMVRQICRTFAKLQMECTPKRVHEAIESFISIEQDFQSFLLSDGTAARFSQVVDHIWSPYLRDLSLEDLEPRHGPGNTADRKSGNQKYAHDYWTDRLEPYFPLYGFVYPISLCEFENNLREEVQSLTYLTPDRELPVKVVPVPKTMKGPRIIAAEPVAMQLAQQSIRSMLYRRIETIPIVGRHVQFSDQSINREIARCASRTGQFSTIDLSEASDRVPHDLAMTMFSANPVLQQAVEACRSTHAKLPDGRIIGPLRKFASMGSALCFPVESMYFYTACVEILLRIQNLPVTRSTVRKNLARVRVYGDDIIIPTTHAIEIIRHLQEYNCKVNVAKSFWTGKFRESCGMDAYDGQEVTPTYIRRLLPNDLRQASDIVSTVKTANLFFRKGYVATAEFLYSKVERILGKLPILPDDSDGLGRVSYEQGVLPPLRTRMGRFRWNGRYHRLEVRAWVVRPIRRTDVIRDYAALAKALLFIGNPEKSKNHLRQTERYRAVALKHRWVPAT
jgi:hypothetical protein